MNSPLSPLSLRYLTLAKLMVSSLPARKGEQREHYRDNRTGMGGGGRYVL